jgi:uncharacterized membrane protein
MRRAFVITALIVGTAFVFVTPPFQVPDEVGHYWRAVAIADGQLAGSAVRLPKCVQTLVYVLWVQTAGQPDVRFDRTRLRTAWTIPYDDSTLVPLNCVGWYTIVPSLPQATACLIGRIFRLRPLITFYLGRLFNLAAFVALVALAMTLAPEAECLFAAAALLPMSMFMAASFSPDVMTIAMTFVLTALALRPRSDGAFGAATLLTALCKPPYFLVAFLGARTRRRLAIALLAMAAGASITFLAGRGAFRTRTDVRIDERAQLRLVVSHPLHYAAVTAGDFVHRGREYGEEIIGVLGWLDVRLPGAVMLFATIAVIAIALTSGTRADARVRVAALAILAVCVLAISFSLYLTWSAVGAGEVAGIQGRYFLPLLPLLLIAIGIRPHPLPPWVVAAAFLVIDVVALYAVWSRYSI